MATTYFSNRFHFNRFYCIALILALFVTGTVSGHAERSPETAERGKRVLQTGSELDYPPLAMVDNHGAAYGLSVDVLEVVMQELGQPYTVKVAPWNELKDELRHGNLDFLPLVARSETRDEYYDFTAPYLIVHGAIFTNRNSSDIVDYPDLEGRKVIVMEGDIAHDYILANPLEMQLLTATSVEEGLKRLSEGEADAMLVQRLVGINMVRSLKLKNIRVSDSILEEFSQPWCFAVREGDHELLEQLNEGLLLVASNGQLQKIREKWLREYFQDLGSNWRFSFFIAAGIAIALVLILLLIWSWKLTLQTEVERQTAQLNGLNRTLEESNNLLSSLLASIPIPVFYKDLSLRYMGCNTLFAEFYGFSREQMIGKTVWDVTNNETAQVYAQRDRDLLQSQKKQEYEISVPDKDGKQRTVVFCKAVFHAADGEPAGIVGAMLDITDLRAMEIQLKQARDKAEKANVAKSEFLATMSHEIRTPLNALIGVQEILSLKIRDPEYLPLLKILQSSANQLIHLINQTLDLSKIEAGELVLSPEPTDLRETMEEVAELFRYQARQKRLVFSLSIEERCPASVACDQTRLREILINLLSNAVKFTASGSIAFKVDCGQPEAEDRIWLRFSVRDTGPGIPAREQQVIFDPFHQLPKRTLDPDKNKGSGLGLAITRKLCEAMGGQLGLESDEGQGSHFWFDLPVTVLKRAPAPPADDQPPPQESPTSKRRWKRFDADNKPSIWMIEDDPITAEVALEVFAELNVDVRIFELAEAFFKNLEDLTRNFDPKTDSLPFDFVISDLRLRGMSGYDMIHKLRQHKNPVINSIRVVVCSASALSEDRERCVKAGFDDFLPKPYHMRDIYAVIKRNIQR